MKTNLILSIVFGIGAALFLAGSLKGIWPMWIGVLVCLTLMGNSLYWYKVTGE